MQIYHQQDNVIISGEAGTLSFGRTDEVGWKLCMLLEGECLAQSPAQVARRYGYSKQRYYQLRAAFGQRGTGALASQKRGPKRKYRRGGEVTRQIIRYRYLDPDTSCEVIGQRLRQDDWPISDRSVYRVFEEYGLQKKGSTSAAQTQKNH